MADIFHDALIITIDIDELEKVMEYVYKLSADVQKHITAPVLGLNGVVTISFLSDGSKYGWGIDSEMQDARWQLIKFVEENCDNPDIVLLQYGGDSEYTDILYSTD
ncbi:hypothetical protein RE474_03740 [Methanolobus sediminis]|uniref:Uncharacterized protein n=1 Tax=Methanolobus sediminis TaxID=3072978 RepID=A0AA51ULM7_9EURY|nr:hypothetical protein [Methanolobus sediminis]WMW25839.1 hypothetical protein RE474_03740 [Methanolobus sediminis]